MLSFISAYLREVLTRFFILYSTSDLRKYKKCEQSLDRTQALMLSSTGSDHFASRVVEYRENDQSCQLVESKPGFENG